MAGHGTSRSSLLAAFLFIVVALGAPVDESIIEEFLESAQYSKDSILVASPTEACSTSGCCIHLLSPIPGYQAEAAVSLRISGERCVGSDANLLANQRARVLVDGYEEAESQNREIRVLLPGLTTGNHILSVRVEQDDSTSLVEYRSQFVVLGDVEILFPSDGFVFQTGGKLVLAFSVSPTALDRFCVDEVAPSLAHCATAAEEGRAAKGIGIYLNGQMVSDFDMKAEDGDDGRRTYHADMMELPPGAYEVGVQLQGPREGDGSRARLGDVAFVAFEVAECARNGAACSEEPSGEGSKDWGGGQIGKCPAVAQASCRPEEGDVCSGHGECVGGVCLCSGDYIGEHCAVSLFHATSYLPGEGEYAVRCAQGAHWMEGSRALLARLVLLHSADKCNADHALLFATRMHGLGAQLHYLTECLTRAVQEGKAMVMATGPDAVRDHTMCGGGDMKGGHHLATELYDCYLHRFFQCRPSDLSQAETEPWANNSRYAGDEYQTVPKGSVFWWRAHVAYFLIQPGRLLETTLRQVKAALGFKHPLISVHVRHGDACMHASISQFRPQCVEWEVYLERIYEMRDKYGVSTVYLATDDPAVSEAAQLATDLQILQLDMDREVFSADWFLEFRSQMGLVSAKDVTESALVDLLLLSEGDLFVGTFASHLSRIAYELMVARLGYFPPYSSVDYPWCFHFMHKGEVPGYGLVNC